MPWHIEEDHPDCDGWAVVKDDDNSVAGCHGSEDEAKDQLAALYASEDTRMATRSGRILSARNEAKLRDAVTAIVDVLSQLADADETDRALRGLSAPYEQRTAAMGDIEIRNREEQPRIAGYAAVFDSVSRPLYGFREEITPGAFGDWGDVRALWQHDTARVLGRTGNGTLQLREDARGLAFELTPPATTDGRDALELIARGDVDQMSFGFTVPAKGDEWTTDPDGYPLRRLHRVNLIEISPVTFPAYTDTTAAILRTAPPWVQRALARAAFDIEGSPLPARARLEVLRKRLRLWTMED